MKQYPITLSFFEDNISTQKHYRIRFKQRVSIVHFSFALKKDGGLKYPLPETQKSEFIAMSRFVRNEYISDLGQKQLGTIYEAKWRFVRKPQEIRDYLLDGFVEDGYIYQAKPKSKKTLEFIYNDWYGGGRSLSQSEYVEEYFVYRP